MTRPSSIRPLRVVIAGGGIAALETVLALHDLAEAQLDVTLIAPEPDFVLRPLAVREPFAGAPVPTLSLARFMAEHAGRFVRSAVLRIDPDARRVACASGSEVPYDVLVLALGASSTPAFGRALTFGYEPLALAGIIADLEQGWSHSIAFVAPRGCTWSLPLYELALLTAEHVYGMNMDGVQIHVVTPEGQPLEVFGPAASAAVAELLTTARITLHAGADPRVERAGQIDLGDGTTLGVDRIVALPTLEGPRLDGVPCDAHGFIPVDEHGAVEGMEGVYAVGDAADHAIKQGGLACQQADAAAAHIAAAAGADIVVPPPQQVLRGRLLTGRRDRFLRREGEGQGEAADEPLWWPPGKVGGRRLAPYLAARGVSLAQDREPDAEGLDVEVVLPRQAGRSQRTGSPA